MCSDERGSWQRRGARGKYAARGKGPQRSPREGTFRDARYVRNLSSTAATITSSVLLLLWLRARRNLPADRQMFSLPWKAVRRARQTMHDNASTFRSRTKATRRSDGKSREMENDVSTGSLARIAHSALRAVVAPFNRRLAIFGGRKCVPRIRPNFYILRSRYLSFYRCVLAQYYRVRAIKWNINRRSC